MGRAIIIQYRILTIRNINIHIIPEYDQNLHIYQYVLNHIFSSFRDYFGNSDLKLTSTTHEVNKKSLLLYPTNLAKYSKFTHKKCHIYLQVSIGVKFWYENNAQIIFFCNKTSKLLPTRKVTNALIFNKEVIFQLMRKKFTSGSKLLKFYCRLSVPK